MPRRVARWPLAGICWLTLGGVAGALPDGPQVIHGHVQVVQPQGNVLQILQSSPQAILNWQSFSIQADQWVQFLQANSQSIALNRVVGGDPSRILGQLSANGRIFLVNPNGILFGPQSTVNAGSFLASTLDIQDQDFLANRFHFQQAPGLGLSSIVQQGRIEVGEHGWLVLLAPLIDNQGLILAQQGQVVLGAAQQATLSLDPMGLLHLALPQPAAEPASVLLSASQVSQTLAQVISSSSLVEAGSITTGPEGIVLQGAEGVLLHQGQIQTKDLRANSSQATVLAPQSQIDSTRGNLEILSQGTTWSGGSIRNPDGFVEISGSRLGVYSPVEVGPAGTLYLDPGTLRVTDNPGTDPSNPFQASGADHSVNASVLASQTGNVTLQADDDIIVESGVAVLFNNTVDVLLIAGRDILMETGSSLVAGDSDSTIEFRSGAPFGGGGRIQLQEVGFNTITVSADGVEETQLFGNLGRSGSLTAIDIQSPNITLKSGSQVEILGSSTQLLMEATLANLILEDDTQLSGPGGIYQLIATNDLTLQGLLQASNTATLQLSGDVTLLPGADLRFSASGSQVNLGGGGRPLLLIGANIDSPTIQTIGASTIDILGTNRLGAEGQSSFVGLNSSGSIQFTNANLQLTGSDTQLELVATDTISLAATSQIDLATTPGQLTFQANTLDLLGDLHLPQAGSSIQLTAQSKAALGNVQVNGSLSAVVQGDIEVAGEVSVLDLQLNTPASVIGTQPGARLFAQNSLEILNASHLYGSGPEQSLRIGSGPTANVVLDVNGSNFTDMGPPGEVPRPVGVAASVLYPQPRSNNFTVNNPLGEVRILSEESPPPPPSPPPPGQIPPRNEEEGQLSSEEVAELTRQTGRSQPHLANQMPPTLNQGDGYWEVLSLSNPGLSGFFPANLSSLVIETVVLSPEEVSQREDQERLGLQATRLLLADQDESDEDVRFWRALIERVLIWEEED